MSNNNLLTPLTTKASPLPSFSSLRARNLSTLYNHDNHDNRVDKSPKGCIDDKIAPLCHLINAHDEYVTTSSCSGRVALFDPDELKLALVAADDDSNDDDETVDNDDDEVQKKKKSTALSGKGRGHWRFVTHDTLDDMGSHLIHALEEIILELQVVSYSQQQQHERGTKCHYTKMLTLKYEPPLLHIAAASITAGKRLLQIFKPTCRESGLVVTDQRVTVEVRSMGTSLCVPIFVTSRDDGVVDNGRGEEENDDETNIMFQYSPSKEYIMELAELMKERMVHKDGLLDRLYNTVKQELFLETKSCVDASCDIRYHRHSEEYEVELQMLPSLNLWKTAAVALTSLNGTSTDNANSMDETMCSDDDDDDDDVQVIAFGGQGIGPNGDSTTCQRWEDIFCLSRTKGIWSDTWEGVKIFDSKEDKILMNKVYNNNSGLMTTAAGRFQVEIVKSIGRREGHSACILPSMTSNNNLSEVVVIFGGRTGGPLSPTNDLFFFTLQRVEDCKIGMLCKPSDVRGSPPTRRFGHTMTALKSSDNYHAHVEGDPIALVTGGTGISHDGSIQALSCVYILSRCDNLDVGHHLLWERLSCMQVPRFNHSAFRCHGYVIVFGGLSQFDDPFDDDMALKSGPCCEVLTCGNGSDKLIISKHHTIPSLVGCASIELKLDNAAQQSSQAFLVGGGIQTGGQTINNDKVRPLQIFQCIQNDETIDFVPSKINVVGSEGQDSSEDLGVCVHHCLVQLPSLKQQHRQHDTSYVSSCVLVGGGVPSFSFGQSYANSRVITVRKKRICKKLAPTKKNNDLTGYPVSNIKPMHSQVPVENKTETNVIYVKKSNAKKAKIELESLGYLDKRYKMIPVANDSNLIAIPITEVCYSYLHERNDNSNGSTDKSSFEPVIVQVGRELVPCSSSLIAVFYGCGLRCCAFLPPNLKCYLVATQCEFLKTRKNEAVWLDPAL
eukprot:scaffold3926_cov26-Cyclotella_meneghiniana.AAC.4